MTTNNKMYVDAISTDGKWESIDWKACTLTVRKLQLRIARWVRSGNWRKVKALQWLLTHSFAAKCLAVRKITQNKGHRTPGVDGKLLTSPEDKWQMVGNLKRRGYKALPLRRIYILKSDGKKKRPLGIPSMRDRAHQALHTLALLPIAEMTADWNSYGFRPERSTADAIEHLFMGLAKRKSSQWVMEGDIKACFDKISHEWLMENIPMDKQILSKWLKAGYMETRKLFPTTEGTPQGGLASPTFANMVLDGIEDLIGKRFGSDKLDGYHRLRKNPIIFVRYADDFVVIGKTKEVLELEVKPMIKAFLADRGLELSEEKTKITHIYEGFDFLGQNIRKYQQRNGTNKLLIKPSKNNVHTFLTNIRKVIKSAGSMSQTELIRTLNPKIRGWAYYHRSIVSSKIYSQVDNAIWQALWRWSVRRHPSKGKRWIHAKYFHRIELRKHCFQAFTKENGKTVADTLFLASNVEIKRHIKIKQQATPFDLTYNRYFQARTSYKWKNNKNGRLKVMALWKRQLGYCPVCLEKITQQSGWVIHWHISKLEGGQDVMSNLSLLHPRCYRRG